MPLVGLDVAEGMHVIAGEPNVARKVAHLVAHDDRHRGIADRTDQQHLLGGKIEQPRGDAVALWFAGKGDFRNVHVANLLNVSAGLGIAPAELLQPLPGLENTVAERRLNAEFCWDCSYADIYWFLAALAQARPRAVARLIESRGIYEAAAVVGIRVWRMYPTLRQRLPAARRAVVDTARYEHVARSREPGEATVTWSGAVVCPPGGRLICF